MIGSTIGTFALLVILCYAGGVGIVVGAAASALLRRPVTGKSAAADAVTGVAMAVATLIVFLLLRTRLGPKVSAMPWMFGSAAVVVALKHVLWRS
jgi:hypothetical protein